LAEALAQTPPLLGNRRQGPDLQNVALRRTREWNRRHLLAPRLLAPGSRMPSYRHLFTGDAARGEALLDYLATLGTGWPAGEAGAGPKRQ
jgi:cytochrome c oxidase cbb3-type subunit 2